MKGTSQEINQTSLIRKIQKLLQLSRDDAATEHEAALAAAKVHELLASYNLSLAEVEEHVATETSHRNQDMKVEGWNSRRLLPWERLLWLATCKLYFCCSTLSVGRSFIIGRAHNVIVAKEMLTYLIETVRRLRKAHYGKGRRFLDSFAYGCAQSISDKIKELIAEREPAPEETLLPAIQENYRDEVFSFLADQGKRVRRLSGATRSLRIDPDGYVAGQLAGEGVGLEPQLPAQQENDLSRQGANPGPAAL